MRGAGFSSQSARGARGRGAAGRGALIHRDRPMRCAIKNKPTRPVEWLAPKRPASACCFEPSSVPRPWAGGGWEGLELVAPRIIPAEGEVFGNLLQPSSVVLTSQNSPYRYLPRRLRLGEDGCVSATRDPWHGLQARDVVGRNGTLIVTESKPRGHLLGLPRIPPPPHGKRLHARHLHLLRTSLQFWLPPVPRPKDGS